MKKEYIAVSAILAAAMTVGLDKAQSATYYTATELSAVNFQTSCLGAKPGGSTLSSSCGDSRKFSPKDPNDTIAFQLRADAISMEGRFGVAAAAAGAINTYLDPDGSTNNGFTGTIDASAWAHIDDLLVVAGNNFPSDGILSLDILIEGSAGITQTQFGPGVEIESYLYLDLNVENALGHSSQLHGARRDGARSDRNDG